MNRIAFFIWPLLLLLQSVVQADERILSFHSDITVKPDSSMQVVETIKVRSEQNQIQRGIYRDFPTRYRDQFGNNYVVEYEVNAVQRDGQPEKFFSQPQENGIRTYLGRQNVILPPGEYTYNFTYTTKRQLGFFEDHDELYWNVTGNGWAFPIDQASARVFLPDQIDSTSVTAEAFTGVQGSTEQAFEEYRTRGGTVLIEASRSLASNEGLTIVVNWPKGFVAEPSWPDNLEYFYKDNRHTIVGAAGLLLLIVFYLISWRLVGKDPDQGVIITRYEPPDGFSPAALRFIESMHYDQKCFAAALISLAVKGHLKITESIGEFSLERSDGQSGLSQEEAVLEKNLFRDAKSRTLNQTNHSFIRSALQAHEASLRRSYEINYFVTNFRYFVIGLVITIAVLTAVLLSMSDPGQLGKSLFLLVWLTIWSVGVFALISVAIQAWRSVNGMTGIASAIQVTVFAAIFSAVEVTVLVVFGLWIDWTILFLILLLAVTNWMFYHLLKAPTLTGRNLMDRIEGFRNYIEVAEKQELAARHPDGRCPEPFERYLPYALALGVEQQWSEKFTDVLTKVSTAGTAAYHPVWYSGEAWDHNHIGDFSASLSNGFTSAIAASTSAPGSVSGSSSGGGGGSSGGGGGGGGW